MFWKKEPQTLTVKETFEQAEILRLDRFDQPKLLFIRKPQNHVTYHTGKGKHSYIILTQKPIQTIGDGQNIVADKMTISFVKALCLVPQVK